MATTSTTTMNWMQTMPDVKELEKVREQLTNVYNTIDQTYVDLTNAGRENEAAQLREAAERFAKIGSAYGANSFVRQAAIQDLANKFRIAGQVMEGTNQVSKINQQLQTLSQLAGASKDVFNAGMQKALATQEAQQADLNSMLGYARLAFDQQRNTQQQKNIEAAQTAQRVAAYKANLPKFPTLGKIIKPVNLAGPAGAAIGPSAILNDTNWNKPATTPWLTEQGGGGLPWSQPLGGGGGGQSTGWNPKGDIIISNGTVTNMAGGNRPSNEIIENTIDGKTVLTSRPKGTPYNEGANADTTTQKKKAATIEEPTGFVKTGVTDWLNTLLGATPMGQVNNLIKKTAGVGAWLGKNW